MKYSVSASPCCDEEGKTQKSQNANLAYNRLLTSFTEFRSKRKMRNPHIKISDAPFEPTWPKCEREKRTWRSHYCRPLAAEPKPPTRYAISLSHRFSRIVSGEKRRKKKQEKRLRLHLLTPYYFILSTDLSASATVRCSAWVRVTLLNSAQISRSHIHAAPRRITLSSTCCFLENVSSSFTE